MESAACKHAWEQLLMEYLHIVCNARGNGHTDVQAPEEDVFDVDLHASTHSLALDLPIQMQAASCCAFSAAASFKRCGQACRAAHHRSVCRKQNSCFGESRSHRWQAAQEWRINLRQNLSLTLRADVRAAPKAQLLSSDYPCSSTCF